MQIVSIYQQYLHILEFSPTPALIVICKRVSPYQQYLHKKKRKTEDSAIGFYPYIE